MKETGYVEGQNVAIEYRSDEGQTDKLPHVQKDSHEAEFESMSDDAAPRPAGE
jgi:hypothetical protein